MLEQVVGNVFNGVSRSLLGTFRHSLKKDGNDGFVEVCSERQVLHSRVLSGLLSLIFSSSGLYLFYPNESDKSINKEEEKVQCLHLPDISCYYVLI